MLRFNFFWMCPRKEENYKILWKKAFSGFYFILRHKSYTWSCNKYLKQTNKQTNKQKQTNKKQKKNKQTNNKKQTKTNKQKLKTNKKQTNKNKKQTNKQTKNKQNKNKQTNKPTTGNTSLLENIKLAKLPRNSLPVLNSILR